MYTAFTDDEIVELEAKMLDARRLALGVKPGQQFTITAEHSAVRTEMRMREHAASKVRFANEKVEKERAEKEYIDLHGHRMPMQVNGVRAVTYTGFDGQEFPAYRTPTDEENSSNGPLIEGDWYSYSYSGNSGYYTVEHVWRGGEWVCSRDDTPWQMR